MAEPETSPAVALMPRIQQTLLFPLLVARIDPDRQLQVLEIGPALPETIAFFSQYRCRLHCAAMYSDPVLEAQCGDVTETDLVTQITRSFAFPANTKFDLCLFWDFLNYLDDKALKAFNTALTPFIHQKTRGHAFTVRTLDTSFANQQYGIENAHAFKIRPRAETQKKCFPHTQAILVNMLSGFDVDQGMLLPDGRLEVLMSASDGSQTARPRHPKRSTPVKKYN